MENDIFTLSDLRLDELQADRPTELSLLPTAEDLFPQEELPAWLTNDPYKMGFQIDPNGYSMEEALAAYASQVGNLTAWGWFGDDGGTLRYLGPDGGWEIA